MNYGTYRLVYQGITLNFRSSFFQYDIQNVVNIECYSELILDLRPANERRRYKVTSSLIGWAQA